MKYHSRRTYSALCNREFASRKEAERADELYLLQWAGEIGDLEFQKRFILSDKPKVSIAIDFAYKEDGEQVYEDTKGVMTRDFGTKLIWLEREQGIVVRIT